MSGKYAAGKPINKWVAMGVVALLFATLLAFQEGMNSAKAAWNSGGTTDYVGTFDGTDDYFLGNSAQALPSSPGSFTLEALVKPNDTANLQHIFDQSTVNSAGFDITATSRMYVKLDSDEKILFYMLTAGNQFSGEAVSATALPTGDWSHIALVYDHGNGNGNVKLLVGGVQQNLVYNGATVSSVPYTMSRGFGPTVTVGAYYYDTDLAAAHTFSGGIDQVKIWNSALSGDQLLESKDTWASKHGNSEIAGSANLVVHYDFNEGPGTTLFDRVAGTKNLTAVNGPTQTTKAPRLLIDPTRSVVISDIEDAVSGSAVPIVGDLTGAPSPATYILRLESNFGSFAVGNLNGATKQSGSDARILSLSGTIEQLNDALDSTNFTATSATNHKIYATLTPVLDSVNLNGAGYKQLLGTGHLYKYDSTSQGFTPHQTAASSLALLGNVGYIATSTSELENDQLAEDFSREDTAVNIFLGSQGNSGVWSWAHGPEAGLTFYTGTATAQTPATPGTPGPGFDAFRQLNATRVQPDADGSSEYCLRTNYLASSPVTGETGDGVWDDASCTSGTGALYEFGGQDGEPGAEIIDVTVTAPTVPGQVTGTPEVSQRLVDADIDPDSVTLTWNAVSHVPSVTSYVVEYSVNSDFSGATALSPEPSTNSVTITNLTDGATHYFRVKARNSAGPSDDWSATATSVPVSNQDYALDFDGSFTATAAGSAPVLTADNAAFSVEAWVKADTITGYSTIFTQGQSAATTANRFWLGFNVSGGNYLVHIGRTNSTYLDLPIQDPRGRWVHVAATVSGTDEIKLYIDGVLISTVTSAATVNTGTNTGVGIGSDDNGLGNFFDGQIDQVKVWADVLDQSEVALSMHTWGKPSSGVDNTLRAHWDFNDFTSTGTLKDQVGNYNLTLTSAATGDYKSLVTADTSSVPGRTIYKFTRSYLTATNGWTKPAGLPNTAKVVVAGGGGGGAGATVAWTSNDKSGGGGAGGAINVNDQTDNLSSSTYLVKVGQGGAGGTTAQDSENFPTSGANGESSVFGSFTGAGGGGGQDPNTDSEMAGGSTSFTLNGTVTNFTGGRNTNNWEGAGGGASAAASLPTFSNQYDHPGQGQRGQDGAAAKVFADLGNLALSGGGGGGSALAPNVPPDVSQVTGPTSGGAGAGGGGGKLGAAAAVPAGSGQANTAGGGGGASGADSFTYSSNGGNGGSGVVIVSFEALSDPVISAQPQDQAVLFNQNATFSVTATATNTISYQWQTSTDNINWSDVAGATSSSYTVTLNSANDDDYFRVQVTNSAGSATATVDSSSAQLTMTGTTVGSGICEQGVSSNSGVVVYQDGTDCVVAFKDSSATNSWLVPSAAASAEVLIIAGGGGGGGGPYRGDPDNDDNHVNGGGGGAGGFIESQISLTPGSAVSLRVGAGGTGTTQPSSNVATAPTKGTDSTFSNLTAKGGGAGGYMPATGSVVASTSGGSGGGGAAQANAAYPISGAAGTSGQGNSGGNGFNWNSSYQGSGGGGGAGGVGIAGNSATRASGNGGPGKATTVLDSDALTGLGLFTESTAEVVSGGSVYLAAGGGGGQRIVTPSGTAGTGGIGGGGDGGLLTDPSSGAGSTALANTGSGGGGGTNLGGDGATGLIVVRYTAVHDVTAISPTNGIRTSDVDVTISGSKFAFGATAKLTKSGESDVNLTNVVVTSSSQITARIPSGLASGTWNLVVTNPDNTTATLNSAYVATGNYNVEFTEIDFSESKINPALSCGTGKNKGDYQLYENVSTRNGVSIDGYVKTKEMSTGVTITRYEVGARAGGEDSYFQIDAKMPKNPGNGFVVFEFKFFVSGTFSKGATCSDPVTGTQVTLENVNVTGIDIDGLQYNTFSGMDSYTMANNTRLSTQITQDAAPAQFPATGKFYATGDAGSNDPRDQVVTTYGEIDTFEVTVGADKKGDAYYGFAFVALGWGSSTPVTVGEEFTLSYDANQGTGSVPASVSGGVGTNITAATNSGNLTRDGYSFVGWNTRADGTGTTYSVGANYLMPQGGGTLYAKWEQSQYTFTYNANGGSGAPSGASYISGATVTVSTTAPTRSGFTFSGWNTASDGSGTTRVAGSTFAMPDSNVTLYALWTAIIYTVSYDPGNGTGANHPESQTGTQGTNLIVNQNRYVQSTDGDGNPTYQTSYTRTGHTFAGWNTAQDGSGTDFAVGSTITVGQANVTLYAQWTAQLYSLTYVANGGSNAPVTKTNAMNGVAFQLSATVPIRSGYSFTGWTIASDGSGTVYQPSDNFTLASAANGTLYAKWNAITYNITYNANDATGTTVPSAQTGTLNASITVADQPTGLTKNNHWFAGWNTLANGQGSSYAPGATLKVTGSQTLFAVWVPNEYQISYNANGGTGGPDLSSTSGFDTATVNEPYAVRDEGDISRTGYAFTHWSTSADGSGPAYRFAGTSPVLSTFSPPGNTTFFAQWEAIDYTLSYSTQGGDAAPVATDRNYQDNVSVESAASRNGFTFQGWNTAADGSGTMYLANATLIMPASNVTLFAIWDAQPYTLTYSANGGGSAPSAEVRIFGSATPISTSFPTRSGYTFSGWNTQADGLGDNYSPAQVLTMPASNLTLYAKWSVRSFAVTFDDNGGTGGPADQSGDFGTTVTLSTTEPTRTGFVFSSWNTNCDGSGIDYAAGDTVVIGATDLALCAIWVGTDNTLSYNPNGGAGGPATSLIKTGVTVTVSSSTPTRAGYSFSSWNTEADGTGTGYVAGDTFAMPASNEELFAIWIGNPYTVYFNANGGLGSNLPADIASRAGDSVTVPGTAPTRTGYTFEGWFANSGGTGTQYTGNFTMPTSDLVLYAKWQAISYDLVYDVNGGTGTAPSDQAGILDEAITVASEGALAKDGHWFGGWNTADDASGTTYAVGQSFYMPVAGDVLYAIWVPNDYQISYNANGGTGGPVLANGYDAAAFNVAYTLRDENDIARPGYSFSHWSVNADGSGSEYRFGGTGSVLDEYTPTANTTFYAQWTPASITLTYDANTGTGTVPASETMTYRDPDLGSTIVADPTLLSKQHANFVGWNTAANGSGIAYSVGVEFFAPAVNTTLYAQWADVYYVVDFNPLGGTGEPAPLFAKNSEQVTIPAEEPTKSGFTFSGWEKPSVVGTLTAGDPVTVSGSNVMLFATYTAVTGGGGGGGLPPAPPVVVPPPVVTPPPVVNPPSQPEVTPTPTPRPTVTRTPAPRPIVTPRPTQSATPTPTPTPTRTATATPSPTETQVALPPRAEDREVGDGLGSWLETPAGEETQSAQPGSSVGSPSVEYDTGGEVRFTESGALDLSQVKSVTPSELADETISGFAPNSGLFIEVLGSRTGARFVATTANLVDSLTLIEAIRASIPAQAADFFELSLARVGSELTKPEPWTERQQLVAYDYFQASGLDLPVSLADLNFDEITSWIEVQGNASGYVAGSTVFLTLTSSPLVIAQGEVDRFGNIELTGSIPVQYLEPGEHRVRLVGIRSLGGVSVDDNGEIVISDETMREIERFDLGTQATVRLGGKTPEGNYLNAIRVVPLEPVAPWWTLWFILAGFLIAFVARRRHWTNTRTKLVAGAALNIGAALPAVILGWLSTVTLVTWVGLALGIVATLVTLAVQPSEKAEERRG